MNLSNKSASEKRTENLPDFLLISVNLGEFVDARRGGRPTKPVGSAGGADPSAAILQGMVQKYGGLSFPRRQGAGSARPPPKQAPDFPGKYGPEFRRVPSARPTATAAPGGEQTVQGKPRGAVNGQNAGIPCRRAHIPGGQSHHPLKGGLGRDEIAENRQRPADPN